MKTICNDCVHIKYFAVGLDVEKGQGNQEPLCGSEQDLVTGESINMRKCRDKNNGNCPDYLPAFGAIMGKRSKELG